MQNVQVVWTPKQSEWNPWPHLLKNDIKQKHRLTIELNVNLLVQFN